MNCKTPGLVIRYSDYLEYDKIVEILTPEGKTSFLARGVKKPTAKMSGAAQPFTYGEFLLYKKGDKYTLTGFDQADSFSQLSEVTKYSYASFVLEICDAFTFGEEEAGRIFALTLRTLHSIAYDELPAKDAVCFYIIKFISEVGYMPSVDACLVCGEKNFNKVFFSLRGGAVCEDCAAEGDKSICKGAVTDLRRTLLWRNEDMKLIRYSRAVLDDLFKVLLPYIEEKAERRFKSIEFLRGMKFI